MNQTQKALIIDGNSLLFRSYYGTIKQVDFFIEKGLFPTNAIKTMMLILFKILTTNHYDYAVIAFDHQDKNFRKAEFETYKSNRKKLPDPLISQIEPIKAIMPLFGLKTYCISGIEADDVVGSVANFLVQKNKTAKAPIYCEILSSDNDMLQLVNSFCDVIQFKKGISETIRYTITNFKDLNSNLTPNQIVDLKAIAGDKSDNLPGIKGIGLKTAINLLIKFKSLNNLYQQIDFVEPIALKLKLKNHQEVAFQCQRLATIMKNYFDEKAVSETDFAFKGINHLEIKKIVKKYRFSGFEKYLGDK